VKEDEDAGPRSGLVGVVADTDAALGISTTHDSEVLAQQDKTRQVVSRVGTRLGL